MHQLTADLLEGSPSWDKLVVRSCCYNQSYCKEVNEETVWEVELADWIPTQIEVHRPPIDCLITILAAMNNPEDSLLEVLHVICERYPPMAYIAEEVSMPNLFQLSCPCKRSHSVSHLGFLLLEAVEGAMGSATQKVEKVRIDRIQDLWLLSLSNRVCRQERAVKEVFLLFIFTLSQFSSKRCLLTAPSAAMEVMWILSFLLFSTARG